MQPFVASRHGGTGTRGSGGGGGGPGRGGGSPGAQFSGIRGRGQPPGGGGSPGRPRGGGRGFPSGGGGSFPGGRGSPGDPGSGTVQHGGQHGGNGGLKGNMPTVFKGNHAKSNQFMREFRILMLSNRNHHSLAIHLDCISVALSYIHGPKVDDWVEYMLNKVERALRQGVQPEHEALWEMFIQDFSLSFTDTTKVQNVHQELLELQMQPNQLDDYISMSEHLHALVGWGADDASTIMLFKKGLTRGLHKAVLEKVLPHPTTIRGWIEAACQQYKLWAKVRASLGGSFAKPAGITQNQSQKWRVTLGKKQGGWKGVRQEDRMDIDTAEVNALTTEEKTKLQKEGSCFMCKCLGHISKACPNKKNRNTLCPTQQNAQITAHITETKNEKPKEAMVAQIKAMSAEERNNWLNDLVLQGF